MSIIYEDDLGIKFTKLGFEDIFWGTGTQEVERFGENYVITEISGANIPFDDTRTLGQVLVEDYPHIEIVANSIDSVIAVAANMDIITSIANDIENWKRMSATASVQTHTSATFDANTNTMVFTIQEGPTGPEGAEGIQGIVGAQGAPGPSIDYKGTDSVTDILAKTNVSGDAWSASDTGVDDVGNQVAVNDLLLSSATQWINVGFVSGPQGQTGVQGPQGAEGPTGSTGVQGPEGSEGPQGIAGPQGAKGTTGDQGLIGPEGPQGPQGPQGIQGIDGPQGVEGPQGPQGLQGDQGNQGSIGPAGPQGIAGLGVNILGSATVAVILAKTNVVTGDAWIATDIGVDDDGLAVAIDDVLRDTGTKWVNIGSIAGTQGPQGPEGSQGVQGIQGIQGDQGSIGPAGPQGQAGPEGPTGIEGAQGVIGLTGPQGDQGIQGIQGIPGPVSPDAILTDGTIPMDTGYVPSVNLDVITKEYLDTQIAAIVTAEVGEVKVSTTPDLLSGWILWPENTTLGLLLASYPALVASNSVLVTNKTATTFDLIGHQGRFLRPAYSGLGAGVTQDDTFGSHSHTANHNHTATAATDAHSHTANHNHTATASTDAHTHSYTWRASSSVNLTPGTGSYALAIGNTTGGTTGSDTHGHTITVATKNFSTSSDTHGHALTVATAYFSTSNVGDTETRPNAIGVYVKLYIGV